MKNISSNIVIITFLSFNKEGADKRLLEKIPEMYSAACPTDSARKKIQAKQAKAKVSNICKNSFKLGNAESFATISMLFLLVLISIDGTINKALSAPQTIKVQLEPCQKPLTTKIINVLRMRIQLPPLLPPNGMYR